MPRLLLAAFAVNLLGSSTLLAQAGSEPAIAVAPFDATEARKHQQDWANYLKVQPAVTSVSTKMKLALIPPGEFLMGSPGEEKNRNSSEAQHRVRITKPFYLGVHQVKQAEYEAIMGENPSDFAATGDRKGSVVGRDTTQFPVEKVSWNDAVEFCRRLARFRATCPISAFRDGQLAVQYSMHAKKLVKTADPRILDAIAMGWAEQGKFPSAIGWEMHAIRAAPPEMQETYEAHRKLFEAKQPVRDSRR